MEGELQIDRAEQSPKPELTMTYLRKIYQIDGCNTILQYRIITQVKWCFRVVVKDGLSSLCYGFFAVFAFRGVVSVFWFGSLTLRVSTAGRSSVRTLGSGVFLPGQVLDGGSIVG